MSEIYFKDAAWIWHSGEYGEDEYAEFSEKLVWNEGRVIVRLSVCGEYTLFVNGKYAASNQYADFEHYKVYDSIDITDLLVKGENTIGFLAWYWGKSGMRYLTETPGLIFEIECNGNVVSYSNENTLSRKSKAYISGAKRKVTPQLGFGFAYDFTKEDNWLKGEDDGFSESFEFDRKPQMYERPIKKHEIGELVTGPIHVADGKTIIDLGCEHVGYCHISFSSETEQNVNVAYGEILKDGHVKRKPIPTCDFSFDYRAKSGDNEFANYMFRFACRYIEIESEKPIEIKTIGILPQIYPVKERKIKLENELDKKIYEISLNTLKLCMFEHYVDCPWREQCLYVFDSRNQMLTGYTAFEDGNYDYARANLLLMSKDNRKDNIFSICFPSGDDLTIPSFSLYYVLAVKEYIEHSGDLSLAEEVFDKMESILKVFAGGMQDGLVNKFTGENHWNFYDWSEYASGKLRKSEEAVPDFLVNVITVISLKAYADICKRISKKNIFEGIAETICENARKKFYNKETGFFYVLDKDEKPTELANSLAVLSGVADKKTSVRIAEALANGELVECSLSMKTFKYDVLLNIDKEKYKDVILSEIRTTYKMMLDEGATTVWEVTEGADGWEGLGSLCHGWSAIPIHYFAMFKEDK